MIKRAIEIGWLAIEVVAILVILCVLLHLLIGSNNGGYVSFVYANTVDFLQKIPPGTVIGVFLIIFLYWFSKERFHR
ncbi:MAG TPA: hypothetical protein VMT94_05480 [Burkholderiales bacterium]|nr:hypothetical protein [Burkholderiales bacterium]